MTEETEDPKGVWLERVLWQGVAGLRDEPRSSVSTDPGCLLPCRTRAVERNNEIAALHHRPDRKIFKKINPPGSLGHIIPLSNGIMNLTAPYKLLSGKPVLTEVIFQGNWPAVGLGHWVWHYWSHSLTKIKQNVLRNLPKVHTSTKAHRQGSNSVWHGSKAEVISCEPWISPGSPHSLDSWSQIFLRRN